MIRLKDLRIEKNLKQSDLAKIFNVSQGIISNWENGEKETDYTTLCKLADFFNVSVDYLIGHSDELGNAYNAEQDSLSHDEKTLLEAYKALPENLKFHAVGIIRSLANIPTEDNIVKFPNK